MAESSGASLSAAEGFSQTLNVIGSRFDTGTPLPGIRGLGLVSPKRQAWPATPGTSENPLSGTFSNSFANSHGICNAGAPGALT
jgi:hypothetical protein